MLLFTWGYYENNFIEYILILKTCAKKLAKHILSLFRTQSQWNTQIGPMSVCAIILLFQELI